MPAYRIKTSSVLSGFLQDIGRLERFDSKNQIQFRADSGSINKEQLHFLTEAVFFRAFRSYERLVRDLFLLYCLEKKTKTGNQVKSYLRPKSFLHSEELIKSSLRFLDWNNPDIVIKRAETYLKDGFPIKQPLVQNRIKLHEFRKIRNHIAHDSKETLDGYKDVLRRYFGVIPLRIPSPGEFLLLQAQEEPNSYNLLVFFETLKSIANDLS